MDNDIEETDDYTENITVDKSLTIERYDNDATAPQIKAQSSDSHVFDVTADDVIIRGLDIYGATDTDKAGIHLSGSHCSIRNNRCGWDDTHNNYYGIYLTSSSNNTISGNTCNENDHGIRTHSSSNNGISGNTCSSNSAYGIRLRLSSNDNVLSGNICSSNSITGIRLCSSSSSSTAWGNTCSENGAYGIRLNESHNNAIYLNSLTGNGTNAYVSGGSGNAWSSPQKMTYTYNGNDYENHLGNYYGDYYGADDGSGGRVAGDGIGDTEIPYPTDGSGDHYPLMLHFTPGDADWDGDVDVFDWVKVRRILEGLDDPTPGADADTDGDVNVFDWVKVKRILEGLDSVTTGGALMS